MKFNVSYLFLGLFVLSNPISAAQHEIAQKEYFTQKRERRLKGKAFGRQKERLRQARLFRRVDGNDVVTCKVGKDVLLQSKSLGEVATTKILQSIQPLVELDMPECIKQDQSEKVIDIKSQRLEGERSLVSTEIKNKKSPNSMLIDEGDEFLSSETELSYTDSFSDDPIYELSMQQKKELDLFQATANNESIKAISLLTKGVDPNCNSLSLDIKKGLGGSPLCNAVKHGNMLLIQKILEHKASPNQIVEVSGSYTTPLLVAVKQSRKNDFDPFIINLLVQHGADIDFTVSIDYKMVNVHRVINLPTPLMMCVSIKSKKNIVFNTLIACGADINKRDSDGNTALHIAARHRKINLIFELLDVGADYNVKNNDGHLFLDALDNVNDKQKRVLNVIKKKIKSLKAQEKSANKENVLSISQGKRLQNQRALIQASFNNKTSAVLLLLEQGVDPECDLLSLNQKVKLGGSPLCNAVEQANIKLVEKLLISGANPNGICSRAKKEKKGVSTDTPLRVAVRQFKSGAAYPHIIRLLVQHGADVNLGGLGSKEKKSHTALMLHAYMQSPRKDIFKTLLDCGADLNKRDFQGNTALHIAAQGAKVKLIVKLLASGARYDIKNHEGKLFSDMVDDKSRKQKLVALLKNYLASAQSKKNTKTVKKAQASKKNKAKKVQTKSSTSVAKTKLVQQKNAVISKKVKTGQKKIVAAANSAQTKKKAKKVVIRQQIKGNTGVRRKSKKESSPVLATVRMNLTPDLRLLKKAINSEINKNPGFYDTKSLDVLDQIVSTAESAKKDAGVVKRYAQDLKSSDKSVQNLLNKVLGNAQQSRRKILVSGKRRSRK